LPSSALASTSYLPSPALLASALLTVLFGQQLLVPRICFRLR
jgi:hypothetical protein